MRDYSGLYNNAKVNIELNGIFEFYFVDRLERYIIWALKVKKREESD